MAGNAGQVEGEGAGTKLLHQWHLGRMGGPPDGVGHQAGVLRVLRCSRPPGARELQDPRGRRLGQVRVPRQAGREPLRGPPAAGAGRPGLEWWRVDHREAPDGPGRPRRTLYDPPLRPRERGRQGGRVGAQSRVRQAHQRAERPRRAAAERRRLKARTLRPRGSRTQRRGGPTGPATRDGEHRLHAACDWTVRSKTRSCFASTG
mmetsp:Transcript_89187/g.252886  ORF Transcript_89187/g.252886 Transcript_89187/m.252886 type:complete len:204 (+) Transcript_89187:2181-2792(+)